MKKTHQTMDVKPMSPYYQDQYVTIFHGDNRELIEDLGPFDLLLTDPPYGINEAAGKNKSRTNLAIARDYGNLKWDSEPVEEWMWVEVLESCGRHIVWGGNYYSFDPSPCWLVWDKENGGNDFADCELAWTSLKGAVRLKRHQWKGMLRKGKEYREHPTQKPLELMSWCLELASPVESVFDPWMGSGTTLRAAKDRQICAVGIEREEQYCEIAARRMEQEVLPL